MFRVRCGLFSDLPLESRVLKGLVPVLEELLEDDGLVSLGQNLHLQHKAHQGSHMFSEPHMGFVCLVKERWAVPVFSSWGTSSARWSCQPSAGPPSSPRRSLPYLTPKEEAAFKTLHTFRCSSGLLRCICRPRCLSINHFSTSLIKFSSDWTPNITSIQPLSLSPGLHFRQQMFLWGSNSVSSPFHTKTFPLAPLSRMKQSSRTSSSLANGLFSDTLLTVREPVASDTWGENVRGLRPHEATRVYWACPTGRRPAGVEPELSGGPMNSIWPWERSRIPQEDVENVAGESFLPDPISDKWKWMENRCNW